LTAQPRSVEREGLRGSASVGYPALPAEPKGSENAMAAKKKSAAKKKGAAKKSAHASKEDVVYSDVLHELRSSLVSRLIR
jgi:hypothetical protein